MARISFAATVFARRWVCPGARLGDESPRPRLPLVRPHPSSAVWVAFGVAGSAIATSISCPERLAHHVFRSMSRHDCAVMVK